MRVANVKDNNDLLARLANARDALGNIRLETLRTCGDAQPIFEALFALNEVLGGNKGDK